MAVKLLTLYILVDYPKHIDTLSMKLSILYLGLVARKPVFGVSDKASFKPVSSATETS